MSSFFTPARLAAFVGVLTGLSAAATSLLNVFPQDTAIGRVIVGATGVLATVITLAKFLEGQSAWELNESRQAHETNLVQRAASDEVVRLLSNGVPVPATPTATPVSPT